MNISSKIPQPEEERYAIFNIGKGHTPVMINREIIEKKVSFLTSLLHASEETNSYRQLTDETGMGLKGKKAIEIDLSTLQDASGEKLKPEVLKAILVFMENNQIESEMADPSQIIELWAAAEKLSFKELQDEVEFKILDILEEQSKITKPQEMTKYLTELLKEIPIHSGLHQVIQGYKIQKAIDKNINPKNVTSVLEGHNDYFEDTLKYQIKKDKKDLAKVLLSHSGPLHSLNPAISHFLSPILKRGDEQIRLIQKCKREDFAKDESTIAVHAIINDYFIFHREIAHYQLSDQERQEWENQIGKEKTQFYVDFIEHLKKKYNVFNSVFSLMLTAKNLSAFYQDSSLKPHIDQYISSLKAKKGSLDPSLKLLIKEYEQIRSNS